MPRKKKNNGRNSIVKKKKDAAFKTPEAPAERSGTSRSSSTVSVHSSLVHSESASVRTRSQVKRASQVTPQIALPAFEPIDVSAWTQVSLSESNQEEFIPCNKTLC
jgi:hypothetical protein